MGAASFKEEWFEHDDSESVQKWSDRVRNIDETDNTGWTATHYACYYGRPNMLLLLKRKGANPRFKTTKIWQPYGDYNPVLSVTGTTPLHVAGYRGSYECCEILLDWGADITETNSNNRTAGEISPDWDVATLLGDAARSHQATVAKMRLKGAKKKKALAALKNAELERKQEVQKESTRQKKEKQRQETALLKERMRNI